ncbi:MAG TPA: flagellum-specific ATP synthase FliI, partial [Pseudobdellovibrionaceae bacterium]|nr:flagellum-specific ATP synthase FliI [Pseudobdellovibrionaceae bacterium]
MEVIKGNFPNDELKLNLEKYDQLVSTVHLSRDTGKVTEVSGLIIRGTLPGASVGSIVQIFPSDSEKSFMAEVVGFKDRHVLMMPLTDMKGVALASRILLARQSATVKVSNELMGRVVDGMGEPIDGKGVIEDFREVSLYAEPRNPLMRKPIREPIDIGIRAINGMLTIG